MSSASTAAVPATLTTSAVPATPAVRAIGIRKRFGSVVALDGFDLVVEQGRMIALLGPSGCGKTTALRLIAGFARPDAGSIEIAGHQVSSPASVVPAERRRVGLVFQDLALFPHLSVQDNIGYGIRRSRDRAARVAELLALIGLTADARRLPSELSGGMQQRVALARALAPRPDVVLLDEPFSSLDQALRTQLRGEVREILRAAQTSSVFVTHDQDEALTIADQVAVMSRGRIEQFDLPETVYAEPASPFVATFIGLANLLPAVCADGIARTRLGPAHLIGPAARISGRALVVLRPEHIDVRRARDDASDATIWRVIGRRFSGSEILLDVVADDGTRLWCEAGQHGRRLTAEDRVELTLQEIETVAFPSSVPVGAGAS